VGVIDNRTRKKGDFQNSKERDKNKEGFDENV